MRIRTPTLFLIAVLLFALAAPAGALADTTTSSNWSGYAIHGRGSSFHRVVGRWRQPRASCARGVVSYSSFWVGLGGYSVNSPALEQAGTEVDCGPGGNTNYYGWYELVPGQAVTLTPGALRVRPGDAMAASVTVDGGQVTVGLYNDTRHRGFSKVLQATAIDVSSAEWIVEAPAPCMTCGPLPLADFHSATFRLSQAEATDGHLGTIADPSWRWTKIDLLPRRERLGVSAAKGFVGTARPSDLDSTGSSFKVTYSRVPVRLSRSPVARASALGARHRVVDPGR